ncbi:hypothetical protein M758_12G185500 [Ceratodon purpureus]|nr:hypothetical protein M758_12G185500 [Ceratodon purpureus]
MLQTLTDVAVSAAERRWLVYQPWTAAAPRERKGGRRGECCVFWSEELWRCRRGVVDLAAMAMAALPAKDAALITATTKKGANLHDPYCLKRVLDDATSEVVLGRGYVENVSLSNLKMAIGLITCAIALAAQFYPKKFPENKTFLIGCIILYVLFNVLLQYVILTKEKQHILFTHPKSFSGTGLAISSKLPRYSDMYTLQIASADPEHIAAHPPVELTKSVTKWFTKDGVLAEGIFWDDVESLIDDYENESRKSK